MASGWHVYHKYCSLAKERWFYKEYKIQNNIWKYNTVIDANAKNFKAGIVHLEVSIIYHVNHWLSKCSLLKGLELHNISADKRDKGGGGGFCALSEVLFMIFVLFVLCCMQSYLHFPISSFMIAIRYGAILKNVVVTGQSVTIA